ncbi:MAG: hypothetical protein SGI74_09755 [Oligoflexia bacterium]|nr:hypothetical protein [Oligoflexia bacterium]
MKNYVLLTLAVCLLGFSVNASAAAKDGTGVILAPAVMYETSLFEDSTTSKSDTSGLRLDGRLGFKFQFPLYVGGIYASRGSTTKGLTGPDSTISSTGYGVSAGFMKSGFFLIGHYILSAEREDKVSNVTTTYKEGSGFQADIGYIFMVSSKFGIAPEMHYRSVEFKKKKVGSGAEATRTVKTVDLQPYIGLWLMF